jgi:predicted CopG family antitoxin
MKKTILKTIRFSQDEFLELKLQADRENVPFSQLVRRLLHMKGRKNSSNRTKNRRTDNGGG